MSFSVAETPQRPLPGGFINTPGPQQRASSFSRPPVFRMPSNPSLQRSAGPSQSQSMAPRQAGSVAPVAPATKELTPVERAAQSINQKLASEARYPPLEDYVTQNISDKYEIESSAAWAPFQRIKTYDIPDRIFEQYNTSQVSTMMGLFAELHHAWITIDSALYLWDYTHPNPDQTELIGFEDLSHAITAVSLVRPRPGVFVKEVTHLLVVTTNADLHLIGVASTTSPAGVTSVSLYQTGMYVSMKNITVSCIAGSSKTGRIFVGARSSNDVYEITYQQEEKWFSSKCAKICHTDKGLSSTLTPWTPLKVLAGIGATTSTEYVEQLVVDDSRDLVYTLSSSSTIRVFHIKPGQSLPCLITKTLKEIMISIGHMRPPSQFLDPKQTLVAISPISSSESSRLNLMATTSLGVRIFLSATSSNYYSSDSTSMPTSMQPYHVKLPPPPADKPQPPTGAASSSQLTSYESMVPLQTTASAPIRTRTSERYPPGYFLCMTENQSGYDTLFVSAPDTGVITYLQEPGQVRQFAESGQWMPLNSRTEAIGLVNKPFAAAPTPIGFGNELAVQFDQPASEIAILTNSGVHTIRRRRLVDIFASVMRASALNEGYEDALKKFIKRYGLRETCATALAVACGQAMDVTADARVAKIRDDDIMQLARTTFVEKGGTPRLNEDYGMSGSASLIDNVQPSPRAEGLALYLARLVRPLWRAPLLKEQSTPTGGLLVTPTIPMTKLQDIQHDLNVLQEFLEGQKKFIEGMAGPEALAGVTSKQEEIALQGEHQTLNAIVRAIANIIEGIAFVMVLFDDPVDEVVLSLSDTSRQRVRELTYERLFCTSEGRELAKELVKAIVNRNIAKGSNVDTVAEALRRRCGSFCSADDVVIFKAQELLKKASEAGADSSSGRSLLNDSLKLFQKVAGSLSTEHLTKAVEQYISLSFFAGAIRLVLTVAQQRDRPNLALSWIKDGLPVNDPRKAAYEQRTGCYKLICDIITAVDNAWRDVQAADELKISSMGKRKAEAYDEVNRSDDEAFQKYLYDWYLSQGWSDRLLDIDSPYVISYLQRMSKDERKHTDLLWRYYANYHSFFEAAKVQLQLAKSGFDINLQTRIEYLSRAKANASTRTNGLQEFGGSRQSRQEVVREINDLLDLANIQQDILQRLIDDPRISDARKPLIVKELDGSIQPLDELYNNYADQASYYDICLIIYEVADYRNSADIQATWINLISSIDNSAKKSKESSPAEAVASKVRELGKRLNCSETTFPIPILLPILLEYAFTESPEAQRQALETWPVDLFLELGRPYESIVIVLEDLFYSPEGIWSKDRTRVKLGQLIIYTVNLWFEVTVRASGVVFGGEERAVAMLQLLKAVVDWKKLPAHAQQEAEVVREKVDRALW